MYIKSISTKLNFLKSISKSFIPIAYVKFFTYLCIAQYELYIVYIQYVKGKKLLILGLREVK